MPEGEVTIRPATPGDLPGLVNLEQACFAIPWSEDSLRHDLTANPAAHYLVAVHDDGQTAGYAAFWQVLDEGQITNVAVMPEKRRNGIARRLMEQLIGLAAGLGVHSLTLEVRASNLPALQLYSSCGFVRAGLRRGYYQDNGEDAIIMLKLIGQ